MASFSACGEGKRGFWRPAGAGVAVAVKVQPRSRRPGFHGRRPAVAGEQLCLGVAAPAEEGRANAAACAALAELLGVAARDVAVIGGQASRDKILLVKGDLAALRNRLEAL